MSAFLYPVTFDLEGRPCLVVGGGALAERKATGVGEVRWTLRARGVSPDAGRWLSALDGEVRGLVTAGRSAETRTRLEERLGG